VALAAGLLSGPAVRAEEEPSAGSRLGVRIANVTFKDAAGKMTSLYDLKEKKAVVVVFLSFECPNSTSYSPLLADLARSYGSKGAAFVGVCCTDGEDAASVARHAEEYKLGFPVWKDEQGAAVEALKAQVTPEAFVLDHNFVLRYRGRIDDGFTARLKKNLQITHHDLRNALDEVLAGKPVSQPLTEAVGCPISIEKKVKKDGAVTYHRDVQPILQKHCQSCHRPGQVGPFSLMTYRQAVNWASDIKDYTQSRQMPPWKVSEGVAFHNDRRLSEKEVTTLAAWVDEGTPEGNPRDARPAPSFTDGWQLGEPDLVLSPKADFVLGPGGRDLFRCFVLPTNLTEDKYVVAFEVKPGNPRVVHHTLNFIDATGQARRLEERGQEKEKDKKETDHDRGPGYSVAMGVGFFPQGGLGGWAPGQQPHQLPPGYGFRLPRGSDVVVQVHYHRNGRVERDRIRIGLYFAKKSEGMKPYKGGVIPGRFLAIPANNSSFKVTGNLTVAQDCMLHSIMPHMHLIGKQIRVTLQPPEGQKQLLLAIKEWDYNWQETYFLKEPLPLKAGSVLEVEAIYDNSEKNPNNPNHPPRAVLLGEQTTNEMCFVFLGATSDGPGRSPFSRPGGLRLRPAQPRAGGGAQP
jgi:peroxiredoxin